MNLADRRLKVYLRIAVVGIVLLAILWVLFKNRSNYVAVWFFGLTDETKPVNVVWLMLSTALGTMTAWRVMAFAHGLWRDFREVRLQNGRAAMIDDPRPVGTNYGAVNDAASEIRKESTGGSPSSG